MVLTTGTALAQTDPVVMTINGVPVPRSEFEYSFNKNNGEGVVDKKTLDEYVDLFVNYKLKVAAALDEKMDTATAFQEEYKMYRDQQVLPTMVDDADSAGASFRGDNSGTGEGACANRFSLSGPAGRS